MAGLQGLGLVVKILESLLPKVGYASEIGKDVYDAIKKLGRHTEGVNNQQAQKNELQNQMQRMQQMRQQMARPQTAAPPAAAGITPGAAGGPAPAQAA